MTPSRWLPIKRAFFARWARPIRTLLQWVCHGYRAVFLRHVVFIGVTGSCGKTTTKKLIAAALRAHTRVVESSGAQNHFGAVARAILRTRPWHRYCVAELAAMQAGDVARLSDLFRPTMSVVTAIGTDHYRSFRGVEGVKREKGAILEILPDDGTAFLNADDPNVMDMRAKTRARCVTYGAAPGATIRMEGIVSAWPDRLHLDVLAGSERVHVATQLVGAHFASAVAAAMAVAYTCGVPLAEATRGVASMEPEPARLSPQAGKPGVMFLRDEVKASPLSIPPVIDVLRTARASRKMLVMGTLSDYPGDAKTRYRRVAMELLPLVDELIFVGPMAHLATKPVDAAGRRARAFETVREASAFVDAWSQPGDLIVLKASAIDHVERIALSQRGAVACWRYRCGIRSLCDRCRWLNKPDASAMAGPG